MFAVKGVYDGQRFCVEQPLPINHRREVVITFLDPLSETAPMPTTAASIDERSAVMKSLFGILPATVTDDEIRAERLKRYENSY
ncbi:MAG: hypothetical protein LBP75_01205 [Planctomycetota bacterium]|jgi:hypothetical protein|nr:hypothetical protein [Planctomycetota bacterium]